MDRDSSIVFTIIDGHSRNGRDESFNIPDSPVETYCCRTFRLRIKSQIGSMAIYAQDLDRNVEPERNTDGSIIVAYVEMTFHRVSHQRFFRKIP